MTLRCLDGDELLVRDASPAQVGELASGAGIALHELVEESPTLEKVFLELTAGAIGDRPAPLRAPQDADDADEPWPAYRPGRTGPARRDRGCIRRESDLSLPENQRELVGNGPFGAAFASLIGVMATTSEFRHGTIRATFVFTPARIRVVAAKVVASLLISVAFGALAAGLALGTGVGLIRARGYDSGWRRPPGRLRGGLRPCRARSSPTAAT